MTLSYSILRNSGRGGLIGSSETDTGNGFITFHHNLYRTSTRARRCCAAASRTSTTTHYVSLHESGINSRAGAKAKVDNNYFKNSKDILGTFYTARPAPGRPAATSSTT